MPSAEALVCLVAHDSRSRIETVRLDVSVFSQLVTAGFHRIGRSVARLAVGFLDAIAGLADPLIRSVRGYVLADRHGFGAVTLPPGDLVGAVAAADQRDQQDACPEARSYHHAE